MWQRFTERARRVVFYAQEEAGRLGENYVGTEHLLLGLLRENDHIAARILQQQGFALQTIRHEVERQVSRGDGKTAQDMQLTPRAKRIIDLAYDEAKQLNNNYIGTEHLLLGMIREGEGMAGKVLYKVGIRLEPVRQAVRTMQQSAAKLSESSDPGVSSGTPRDVSVEDMPRPQCGDLGIVQRPANGGQLVLAVNEEACQELQRIVAIKDDYAYYDLVKAGLVFPTAPTKVKLLHIGPSGSYLVRFLEGDLIGSTGWLDQAQFERTGPDERPFPPIETPSAPRPPDAPEAPSSPETPLSSEA